MIKDKKIIIISLLIVILSAGLLIYYIINRDYDYSKLLDNKQYDIIYDKISTEKERVPAINIKNAVIDNINQEIDSFYEYYSLFSPDGFRYNYNVSGKILSIIITAYVVHPESTHYDIIYKSFNIDLKELKQLTDKEILSRFNITEEKMEYYLYNKFLNYYTDLVNNNYFTEEQCDFATFLESKNVEELLEDNHYYINNNHLELYKYFNIFTDYQEENYFNEKSFHFIVT